MAVKELLRIACVVSLLSGIAAAQIQIAEGTRLQVRLEQDLSSATAQEGDAVQLSVVNEIKIGGTIAVAQGAPVAGRVVEAVPRTLTSSGKLDFSCVSVMAADSQSVPLRYSQDKKSAASGITNGLIGAGATIIFGPTLTMLKMLRAKDIVLPKGTVVEVFTDQGHTFRPDSATSATNSAVPSSSNSGSRDDAGAATPVPLTIVSITSVPDGAKITVDGADMGAAPASFQIDSGEHSLQIEKEGFAVWKRTITAKPGTPVDLDIKLEKPPAAPPARKPASKPAAKPAGAGSKTGTTR